MTKLEEENVHSSNTSISAELVAKVAMRWIEKAYMAHEPAEYNQQDEFRQDFKEWIKNELSASEPLKEEKI